MYPHVQPPTPTASTLATDPPVKMEPDEKALISDAIRRVKLLYPGPVGDYLHFELESLYTMGFRLDQKGYSSKMVRALLDAEPPCETP